MDLKPRLNPGSNYATAQVQMSAKNNEEGVKLPKILANSDN